MTIKSAIQLTAEKGTTLGLFKTAVRRLFENYEIQEAVFGIVNNTPAELESGFMELDKEYDSLDEALNNVYSTDQGIYVVSPEQILTGRLRKNLSECDSRENVLDISSLEMVGRN